jgi:CUB domain
VSSRDAALRYAHASQTLQRENSHFPPLSPHEQGKYSFETEYKIPGTAAPDGTCSFTYRSTSKKKGEFNSPRYPSNYPSDTNCSFVFLATPNEQVTIIFDHFKVKADNANTTGGAYG